MKFPILRAGLIFGAFALGQTGCHQADKAKTDYTPKKPDDPTSWSGKEVTRGSSDSEFGNSGLPPSTGLKGSLSDEGRDIERSLGIGK